MSNSCSTKDTNPKDALGSMRAPLHLNPVTAQIEQALAHAEGAAKYGQANWTVAGARASVYAGAIERHFKKWLSGEDYDVIETEAGEVKIHHLAKVMACCALVIDSRQRGVLVDDRPPALDSKQLYAMFAVAEDAMKKLATLRKGEVKDFTIADTIAPK